MNKSESAARALLLLQIAVMARDYPKLKKMHDDAVAELETIDLTKEEDDAA